MRASTMLAPTLREVPAEAEIASHQLMLRGGLIRKSSAGMYTYLPLGLRILHKIMAIVREEMNKAGSQELLLPIVQPAELWHETGRWADYGEEMFRLEDRHARQFCLGPTHEEIVTALVRAEIRSYRQLPQLLYQIQNKYRDEIRPRYGVMRGREFIMKDCYSFDQDEEGLEVSYRKMYRAYERIFIRCGLGARPVEADPGAIGGNATHEFMVVADAGEAGIVLCTQCDYAANTERAESVLPKPPTVSNEPGPARRVETPGVHTVEAVTAFLGTTPDTVVKTLLYVMDGKPVAALVRGDHSLNEVKLARVLGGLNVGLADAATVERITKAPVGFAGPVGLAGVQLIADPAVMQLPAAVVGANAADAHLVDVVPGRDFQSDRVADIRTAVAGDLCPRCGGLLREARGIEVGQVFKLGTKYSAALDATFTDEDGEPRPMVMGCYGIGVTRTMAAIIEQHHDADGMIWPVSVAPYHVTVVPVNNKDGQQMAAAERLYKELLELGLEVLLDDRDERPGVKFKDADLIGYPVRVTVGPKALQEGQAELRLRSTGEERRVPLAEVAAVVHAYIAEEVRRLSPA